MEFPENAATQPGDEPSCVESSSHSSGRVNRARNGLLILCLTFSIVGLLMIVNRTIPGTDMNEIYRTSLDGSRQVVVLQGPRIAPSVFGKWFKMKDAMDYGQETTEVRVEMRTDDKAVLLWSSLMELKVDPQKSPLFFVKHFVVRDNYFVMVTYGVHSVCLHKVYPFGDPTPTGFHGKVLTGTGEYVPPPTVAAVQSVKIASPKWSFLATPFNGFEESQVEIDLKELPNDRFSLTIKDMSIPQPPTGGEYPVFEQDESGKWEFVLKNPKFMSTRSRK